MGSCILLSSACFRVRVFLISAEAMSGAGKCGSPWHHFLFRQPLAHLVARPRAGNRSYRPSIEVKRVPLRASSRQAA